MKPYIYRPLTDEHKAKLRRSHQKRLGIPAGYCLVQNTLFPIGLRKFAWATYHRTANDTDHETAVLTLRAMAYDIHAKLILDALNRTSP